VKVSRDHINFTNKGRREYRDGFGGGLGLNYFSRVTSGSAAT